MPAVVKSKRFWIWALTLALYALFWAWYTPLSGPMTQAEVDAAIADFEARGASSETLARMRSFFEADDGASFIMVNVLDLAADPPELPATGPKADAEALLDHYMEFMWPALLSRACHPVFSGSAVGESMDVVGIDNAKRWSSAALMRYRSRRDLWQISADPRFGDRHDYKVAALEKTIAVPVAPQLLLGDPRLIVLLALLAALGLIDMAFARRK